MRRHQQRNPLFCYLKGIKFLPPLHGGVQDMERLGAVMAGDDSSIETGYIRPKRGETADDAWLEAYLEASDISLAGDGLELWYEEPRPRGARITIQPTESGGLYGVETDASAGQVTVADGHVEVEEEIDGVHYRTRIRTGDP